MKDLLEVKVVNSTFNIQTTLEYDLLKEDASQFKFHTLLKRTIGSIYLLRIKL